MVHEYKDSKQSAVLSGTEWVAKTDDWKIEKHDVTNSRQLVLSKENHLTVAKGGNFEDHIDVCSEFVVKFLVKAEKKQKGTFL